MNNEERKARVAKAIEKFTIKKMAEDQPKQKSSKRNASPEKDVERDCMAWMKAQGWDVQIAESKSVLVNDRWQSSGIKAGTCDCFGISSRGEAVFVEFKAPGKRSSFWREGNERQVDYLLSKIERGAFACVVDSDKSLAFSYMGWLDARQVSRESAVTFLLQLLPKRPVRNVDPKPLFTGE